MARVTSFIMFMISPIFSIVFFLKHYYKDVTKNLIWAFCVFYGYTFVLSNDTMDANRLLVRFEWAKNYSGDFLSYYKFLFIYNDGQVNFLEPFIHYAVALFSNDFQVLMAVFGLIFGFFYSRNIDYLLKYENRNIKPYNFLILWTFVFVIGFWSINIFRFYTAALIFFYAITPYLIEGKKKKLWWLIVSVLMHYSFILPCLFFVCYLIMGNRPKLYFFVFICSFLVSSLNLQTLNNVATNILPANFEEKIVEKTSDNAVEKDEAEEKGMAGKVKKLMFLSINCIFIFLYFYQLKEIKNHEWLCKLYVFSLVLLTMGNLAALIPRGGERFLTVASYFCLIFLFFYIQKITIKLPVRLCLNISAPLLLIASLGYLRSGFQTTNIIAIIGNPIVALFTDSQTALIEYFSFI